jgi:hypothetical protein
MLNANRTIFGSADNLELARAGQHIYVGHLRPLSGTPPIQALGFKSEHNSKRCLVSYSRDHYDLCIETSIATSWQVRKATQVTSGNKEQKPWG